MRKLALVTIFACLGFCQTAGATNYFVSSSTGSDSNAGTQTAPWQSLAKVNGFAFAPGDQIEFLRGDTWTGQLNVSRSGTSAARINYFGYGTSNARPVIQGASGDCFNVTASFITIDNLKALNCGYAGFGVHGTDTTVKNSNATGNAVGVHVDSGTSNIVVDKNVLTNNNILNVNQSSGCSGAFGVLLNGPAVVTNNTISGSQAMCADGSFDGSAVELFNASSSWVHHNTMTNNDTGVEMGGTGSGNAVEYNAIVNAGGTDTAPKGIVFPGAVTGTWIAHDSIDLGGSSAQGIVCYSGCDGGTAIHDVAVSAQLKSLFTDNGLIAVQGSVLNGPVQGIALDATNSTAAVGFVSSSDAHLTAGSPAIDRGTVINFPTDLDGNPVPSGAASDSGAYELQGGSPPPPDTTPPSTPAGLSVTGQAQTSLTLNWNASTDNVGVAGYTSFLNGTSQGTTVSLSKAFGGLACGTTYTLGVQAFDAAGNTSGTATAQGTTSACGSGGGGYQHIVWVVMENHNSTIIGSSSAPYITSLANTYGSLTNMWALTHPSLPNYIAMTSGQYAGLAGHDSSPGSEPAQNENNVFHQLPAGGSRSLEESMPSNCDKNNSGNYAARHNPMAYYTDLGSDCTNFDVPLNNSAPNLSAKFTFITPNLCHDMHSNSCAGSGDTVKQGDDFLKGFVPTLLATSQYQAGNTAIFITWDEGTGSGDVNSHIPTIVINPNGAHDTSACQGTRYTLYSLLRYVEDTFAVPRLAGAASATGLNGCFGL